MPRIPLPDRLTSVPFLVSQSGLGYGRLRGPDLARPHHGVRVAAVTGPADYAPLLRPGERFSHITAALLWPLPLPLPLPGTPYPVHVSMSQTRDAPQNPARGRGIVGHTSSRDDAVLRGGLPVSAPASMFVELAQLLGERDLVAVGDALVLDPHELDPGDIRPWITLPQLRAACLESRVPGCRRARRAAGLVREGAESRMESLLRLLLVEAGLPEPELGLDVHDARGRWIGRFDMVYRQQRVIVEYDGDQHRTSVEQYEKDIGRIDRAIAAGWTVVRVRARGIFIVPGQTVRRVREALRV